MTVAPDETTTVETSHVFESTGNYTLRSGADEITVAVVEPATPTVTAVELNRTTLVGGGAVEVSATVANDAAIPALRDLTFVRDGEAVATRTLTLGPGEEVSVSTVLTLDGPGTYSVGVENATRRTVTVEPTPTPTDVHTASDTPPGQQTSQPPATHSTTGTSGPGFGAAATLLALLVAVALALRRS
ncbi:PGF-CTERM sorting domain-containing protein [Haloarculaceae archaeon H-GB2-1]|nr:PGF-CTERM sorting domain-containing protein [Haloarculaceae archaeon H-GB2-1]